MKSETKNLVVIYQKLFNVAYRKYRSQSDKKQVKSKNIDIRKAVSISSFREILISHPDFKNIMEQMYESGELLNSLIKWKGNHCNMTKALKYFNIFINMLKVPENEVNWTSKLQIVDVCSSSEENNLTYIFDNKEQITKDSIEISCNHISNNYIDSEKKQIQPTLCSKPVVGFQKYYALDQVQVTHTPSNSIDILKIPNPYLKMSDWKIEEINNYFCPC